MLASTGCRPFSRCRPHRCLVSIPSAKVLSDSGSLPPITVRKDAGVWGNKRRQECVIIEKETYCREGREQPVLDGRKEPSRKRDDCKKRSFWHSRLIEAESGCQGHGGEWDCIGWGDPDSAPDHLGIAGDAGLLSPLFMLHLFASHARWSGVCSTWLLNHISHWQVSPLMFWQCS